jgi:hypothetical protein
MNEERIGKCLRQVEDIPGHLWHRYSITINHVMVVTATLSSDDFNLTKRSMCHGFVLLDLRSLVLCVCFVDTCLSICLFSVGHFVVVLLRYMDSDNPFGIFKLFLVDLCYGAKPTSFNNNLSIQIWGTAPCVRKFSQLFLNQFKIDVHNITLSSATLYRYNYTN